MTLPFLPGLIPKPYQPQPEPTPPAPQELLKKIFLGLQTPSRVVGGIVKDALVDMAKQQKETLRKAVVENDLNSVMDLAMDWGPGPLVAGSVKKGLSSVARNPASKEFLETLYSRLQSAIVGGPGKAQGQEWLRHLEKGAARGEIDHTGLLEFLQKNKDRVFTRDEIFKQSQVNPVMLKEVREGNMYGKYIPDFPAGFEGTPGTYKETILSSNLPFSEQLAKNKLRAAEIEAELAKLTPLRIEQSQKLLDLIRSYGGDISPPAVQEAMEAYAKINDPATSLANEMLQLSKIPEQAPFHFKEPNQVGWLRSLLGKRDGKISQFFAEGQSDPQQKARILGRLSKEGQPIRSEVERLTKRAADLKQQLADYRNSPDFDTAGDFNLTRKVAEAEDALESYRSEGRGILPLPFRQDKEWSELLLKRALHEAVQNNADEIVFPAGQAVHNAVGMPLEAAIKHYEKSLPNQLADYLKKQLGVAVQPSPISRPIRASSYDLDVALSPSYRGNAETGRYAVNNLLGPVPVDYGEADFITSALLPQIASGSLPIQSLRQLLQAPNPLKTQFPLDDYADISPIAIETIIQDLTNSMNRGSVLTGTSVPIPPEARNKILTEGQRLWALLAAAGIPTFMSQQKKDDPKRNQSRRSGGI